MHSRLALPDSNSPEEDSARVSGTAKGHHWRRRSCSKNPTARSRSTESSCLVCMWLPASCCVQWTPYLQKHGHIPSCLTRFGGGGIKVCKILEDLFMGDVAKVRSIKHFEGRPGRNHSVQNAKLKKKSPANSYLHPILLLAGCETLLWWQERPRSSPCPPTRPNLHTWMCWKQTQVAHKPQLCLQHTTRVPVPTYSQIPWGTSQPREGHTARITHISHFLAVLLPQGISCKGLGTSCRPGHLLWWWEPVPGTHLSHTSPSLACYVTIFTTWHSMSQKVFRDSW